MPTQIPKNGGTPDRCAHARKPEPVGWLLPADRLKDSEARIEHGGFSIFSSVSKGHSKKICQDTAAVIVLEKAAVIGVFDGFGPIGDLLSNELGAQLISLSKRRALWIEETFESRALLRRVILAKETSKIIGSGNGGSTALVAIVGSDGRFSASRLGDSPIYGAGERVEWLFDPNYVIMPTRDGMKEQPLSEARLDPEAYSLARNVMLGPQSVSSNCRTLNIRTMNGRLTVGSILIAASDGLSKNMPFGIDGNNHVANVGGCDDILETISDGIRRGVSAGQALVEKVRGRMLAAVNGKGADFQHGQDILKCADDDLSIVTIGFSVQ